MTPKGSEKGVRKGREERELERERELHAPGIAAIELSSCELPGTRVEHVKVWAKLHGWLDGSSKAERRSGCRLN